MWAVFRREVRNYFMTPLGYVFMGAFLLVSGFFFTFQNLYAGNSDLTALFQMLTYLFMMIVPLLTMRLLSEERRTKTDQLLITSPLSIFSIVTGKFLAACMVLVFTLVGTFLYVGIIVAFSTPYWGLIVSNYLGFFLLCACYIAVGVLMSALTESQLAAAILTFGLNMMLQLLESVGPMINIPVLPWLGEAFSWISLYTRFYLFGAGLISIANVLYYVSFIGVLLLLTVRVIDKRRWSEG